MPLHLAARYKLDSQDSEHVSVGIVFFMSEIPNTQNVAFLPTLKFNETQYSVYFTITHYPLQYFTEQCLKLLETMQRCLCYQFLAFMFLADWLACLLAFLFFYEKFEIYQKLA